jgi:hypothetical protein
MVYYHGSIIGGINELKPFASPYSNLKEPKVYLTTNKQLALHYIWNTKKYPIKKPMLKICEDGVLIFQEMFSGALELFYKGLNGFIYYCEGEYDISKESGVMTCATSDIPVPVSNVEYIEDVYNKIMEYKNIGKFVYERFEDLPQWRYDIIRGHIIRGIKRDNLLTNPTHPDYVFTQEHFPQYWKEATVLNEHGLL